MIQFHSFACMCPVFLTLFVEETVFAPLCILPSFVIHELSTLAWAYLCSLYSIPLVYVPGFVPILCCFGTIIAL